MRANSCRRPISLLLFCLFVITVFGQMNKTRDFALQTTDITQDLAQKTTLVSNEIRTRQPKIPPDVLEQDTSIVRASLPRVRTEFWKVGLTEDDAVTALLDSWKSVRFESPLRFRPELPMVESSFIEYVLMDGRTKAFSRLVRKENPELSFNILKKDLILIDALQPSISEEFEKKGWTESAARQASLVAWLDIRTESELRPTQLMNRASFLENVTEERGLILFTSDPDEADVFQGQNKIGTTSQDENRLLTLVFKDNEEVTVRFAKARYVPETKTCSAKRKELVKCSVALKSAQ